MNFYTPTKAKNEGAVAVQVYNDDYLAEYTE